MNKYDHVITYKYDFAMESFCVCFSTIKDMDSFHSFINEFISILCTFLMRSTISTDAFIYHAIVFDFYIHSKFGQSMIFCLIRDEANYKIRHIRSVYSIYSFENGENMFTSNVHSLFVTFNGYKWSLKTFSIIRNGREGLGCSLFCS